MKKLFAVCLLTAAATTFVPASAQEISLESAPPVVLKTVPEAGATDVDSALTEIQVTFNKPMRDGSWSWSTWGEENFPELTGKPHYLDDGRTCVAPVKLQPGKFYATWLNSQKFGNFKDKDGHSAVPYLLTFKTAGTPLPGDPKAVKKIPETATPQDSALNDDQKKVLTWTDKQFRRFFMTQNFAAMNDADLSAAEAKELEALSKPKTPEYYSAINALGAMRSSQAVQPLLNIAAERVEKDNRDRWMAVRSLGIIGDKRVVPELIHLVYHGNANTRWWAQISLVRLTGVNYGKDWRAWGKWWTDQGGQPAFNPQFVKWYAAPEFAEDKIEATLAEADQKFVPQL